MRVTMLVGGLAAAAMLAGTACAQQMYRWVDKDGRVSYSDKPPPPAAAKDVQQRNVGANVVDSGGLDYATQQAVRNAPITLYTTADCKEICGQARELLQKRGAPFSEVTVSDEKTREALKQASGDTQVPVLVVGRDVTKGWEPGAFHAALDAAGYPKSAPNRPIQAAKAPAAAPKADAPKPDRPAGKYLP